MFRVVPEALLSRAKSLRPRTSFVATSLFMLLIEVSNSLSYCEASQSNSLFGARSSEARVIRTGGYVIRTGGYSIQNEAPTVENRRFFRTTTHEISIDKYMYVHVHVHVRTQ